GSLSGGRVPWAGVCGRSTAASEGFFFFGVVALPAREEPPTAAIVVPLSEITGAVIATSIAGEGLACRNHAMARTSRWFGASDRPAGPKLDDGCLVVKRPRGARATPAPTYHA